MTNKVKVIRTANVPFALDVLMSGQLRYLNQFFDVVALSGKGYHLDVVRQREGVRTIAIGMKRQISPYHDVVSLFRLYRVFKKEKPHIVHSITPKAGLLSMLAAKLAGVPIRLHTFTGLIFPSRKGLMKWLLVRMDRVLCWAATHVYPEGQGVRQDLVKHKITMKPLKVIANGNINGVDTKYFSPNVLDANEKRKWHQKLGVLQNDFVFVFIGRLVRDKGINELVEVFSRLSTPNTKLILVGPLEPKLSPLMPETLEKIRSNPRIVSTGFQADVRPFLAISNVLVFPSYREGFPNVPLQAGAMGLPSIVTNISGSNEIVVDQETGLLIPPKDKEALFEAMVYVLNNPQRAEAMGQKAAKRVKTKFEQAQVMQALHSEYVSLLDKV